MPAQTIFNYYTPHKVEDFEFNNLFSNSTLNATANSVSSIIYSGLIPSVDGANIDITTGVCQGLNVTVPYLNDNVGQLLTTRGVLSNADVLTITTATDTVGYVVINFIIDPVIAGATPYTVTPVLALVDSLTTIFPAGSLVGQVALCSYTNVADVVTFNLMDGAIRATYQKDPINPVFNTVTATTFIGDVGSSGTVISPITTTPEALNATLAAIQAEIVAIPGTTTVSNSYDGNTLITTVNGVPATGQQIDGGNILGQDPVNGIVTNTVAYNTAIVNLYNYALNIANGIIWQTFQAQTTSNVDISNPGTDTFDTVVLTNGQFLFTNSQTDPTENGGYVFNGASNPLTRVSTMDTWSEIQQTNISIQSSTGINSDARYYPAVLAGGTIGTTPIIYGIWSTQYTASTGISISGANAISLNIATTASLGGVIVPTTNNNLSIDGSGNLTLSTTANVIFNTITAAGTNFNVDGATGQTSITGPTGSQGVLNIQANLQPYVNIIQARTTNATPNGSVVGAIGFQGTTTVTPSPTYSSAAVLFNVTATEPWTPTTTGCRLDISLCSVGSATRTQILRLQDGAAIFAGNVTAPTFTGALIGNADTATAASTGFIINTVANRAFYMLFSAAGTGAGAQQFNIDGGASFTYNPATGILNIPGGVTSPLFTGALTGAASGNTTYTANQYGVVVSGTANAMGIIAPVASTTQVFVSGGVAANPSWQSLTSAMLPAANQTSSGDFDGTVALAGWVIPGTAPTITTHFERQGNTMLIQIKIVPAGGLNTVAATAVTSTITGLPVVAGALPMGISVGDLATSATIGNGIVLAASSVIQMPSIGATTDTLIISGSYSLV